ncbi:MAG: endonuclease [Salinivirgaceae bacterium]|nr:endonuclease [Salinivirgaceae bacterium]
MKSSNLFLRISIFSLLLLFATIHVNGQIAPPSNLSGESLKTWLVENYYDGNHQTLGYTTARKYLYNYIDNENGIITCVYSGLEVSSAYGGTTTYPAPINCEHTIPQSLFNEANPMVSDLHHLYPTYENWNSTRSNYPFAEIDDNTTAKWMYLTNSQTTIPTSNIDSYSEYANSTFEPREDHKGNVARSIFYFYTMYPTEAGDISNIGDINVFYQWHLSDPVDAAEIERNGQIETYQGDRNPYIDYPEAVAAAWGFETVPSVPASPSISLITATTNLTINWSDVSNETGYRVYRSTGGSYSLLTSPSANTTSYVDNSVSESVTYSYYVIAYNAEGNSPNSNVVSGQLSTGGTNPGTGISVSEALTQSIGTPVTVDGKITQSFNGVYALEMQDLNGTDVILVKLEISQRDEWSPDLNPSAVGKLIEVVGVIDSYSSQTSIESVSSITEIGGEPTLDTEAPTTPDGLNSSNITETTFTLSWNASTDNTAVTAYDVYKNGSLLTSTTNTTYNVSGLSASTTYTFYVKAKDAAGNVSSASSTLNVTTVTPVDTQAPTVPASLNSSNITETTFTLSWSASTDNTAVTAYDVYKNGSLLTSTTNTSYNVSGLTASTTYTFYVKAKDAAGNVSSASSSLNVTTLDVVANDCFVSDVTLTLVTDNYPSETTWDLKNTSGQTVYSGSGYSNANSTYTQVFSMVDGDYIFTIYDAYGDGICCSYGNGSYTLTDANGLQIVTGGAIGSSEATNFCISGSGGSTPVDDGSAPTDYCSSKGANSSYEWIDLVQLASINNATGNDGGYKDYTGLSTDLSPGSQYTISYSCGFSGSSYTEFWHVYIDFNRDGDFEDADERVGYQSSTSDGTLSSTFTVPSGASIGNTRMRVSMKYDGAATPCESSFSYGEVEDYNINITTNKAASFASNNEASALNEIQEIIVYPNPTKNILNISSLNHDYNIEVYTIAGQKLISTTMYEINGQLNVSNLKPGVYYLKFNDGIHQNTQRFIKQ